MTGSTTKAFDSFHGVFSPTVTRKRLLMTLAVLFMTAATLGGVFFGVAQAQDADGAVNGLTLSSDSPSELTVSWDTPSPAPTDYRVDWAKSGESYQSYTVNEGHVYPAGTATAVTITGLEAGAEYKARIRARYHDGEHADSPWSGPWAEASLRVAAEPEPESGEEEVPEKEVPEETPAPEPTAEPTPTPEPARGAPETITGLALSNVEPEQLKLRWNAAHPEPQDYRVMWARAEDSAPSWRDTGQNAYPETPSYTVTGLEAGVEYRVWVRARYDGRSGPFVKTTALVTSEQSGAEGAPAAPQIMGTVTTSEGGVLLLWGDQDDDTITGYRVLRGPDADALAVIENDTQQKTTTYTDENSPAGQTHAYAVQARNAAGLSPLSNTLTASVPQNEEEPRALRQQTVSSITLLESFMSPGVAATEDGHQIRQVDSDTLAEFPNPAQGHAYFFSAGSARRYVFLDTVELSMRVEGTSFTPSLAVHADAGGAPGELLGEAQMQNPGSLGEQYSDIVFDFEGLQLEGGKDYALSISPNTANPAVVTDDILFWHAGTSASLSFRGEPGWTGRTPGKHVLTADVWEAVTTSSRIYWPLAVFRGRVGDALPLVTNLDLDRTGGLPVSRIAQAGTHRANSFTTAAGPGVIYELSGIRIRAARATSNVPANGLVTVHRDDGGRPAADPLYTLDPPSDFLSASDSLFHVNTFTAGRGAFLDAGATYWIVFRPIGQGFSVGSTTDTAETGEGWLIGDQSRFLISEGGWRVSSTGPAQFEVRGTKISLLEEEPDVDLPGGIYCHRTDRIVLPGHTSSGHLTAGVDTSSGRTGDCFRLETQWGQQYRVEVKFGDTESVDIGGSAWIVYTGSDFSGMSSLGSAVDHNREDGRTFTDFKHNNSTVKSYFVDVAAYDLYSTPYSTNSLTYNGPYTITMTDITGVQHMTNNRHVSGDVKYFESSRLDLPAGTSADFGQLFKTGRHAGGYKLDRIRVPFDDIAVAGASPNIALHLHDASGFPATKLCDIAVPANIVESALTWGGNPPPYDFLAPDCANITLSASSFYYIVFLRADIAKYTLEMTSSSEQDSRGSHWELSDGIAFKSTSPGWDEITGTVIRIELWAKEE